MRAVGLAEAILPENPMKEAALSVLLGAYVLGVVYGTRHLYDFMVARGVSRGAAVYYNRKVIHILGGGLVALATPFIYTSPLFPLMAALGMSAFLYSMRRARMLSWFQVGENAYEVNFTLAWGTSLFILWLALGDPYKAILPAVLISFGDSATGLVRNAVFGYRTKHWIGNAAMLIVSLPLGYGLAGSVGVVAAAVSSIVEKLEYHPIDDNILIAATATAILLVDKAITL